MIRTNKTIEGRLPKEGALLLNIGYVFETRFCTFKVCYNKRIMKREEKKTNINTGISSVFRKKSMTKISTPEQLNDYLKLTNPGIWILLAALVLLVAGLFIFAAFGTVTIHTEAGTKETIHPIEFLLND